MYQDHQSEQKNVQNDKNTKKNFWQFIKFLLVSGIAGIIQLVLANVLPFIFDNVRTTIPGFLQIFFNPNFLFNVNTEKGAAEYALYVVNGVVTWGFVIPFFLSNAIANVFGYIQNKKTTFKSDAPASHFVIYFIILTILILVSTWLQGLIVGKLNGCESDLIRTLSRTIAAAAAGLFQLVVLFPLEKFVLLKEKPEH